MTLLNCPLYFLALIFLTVTGLYHQLEYDDAEDTCDDEDNNGDRTAGTEVLTAAVDNGVELHDKRSGST